MLIVYPELQFSCLVLDQEIGDHVLEIAIVTGTVKREVATGQEVETESIVREVVKERVVGSTKKGTEKVEVIAETVTETGKGRESIEVVVIRRMSFILLLICKYKNQCGN